MKVESKWEDTAGGRIKMGRYRWRQKQNWKLQMKVESKWEVTDEGRKLQMEVESK